MNKLILVPESMYNGLLTSNDFKNHTNLDFIRNKLENVRKNKTLKASTKNVLYNQELRRYLALRRDEMDKPIKVEVTGGVKYITKPNSKTSLKVVPTLTGNVGDDIEDVDGRMDTTDTTTSPPPIPTTTLTRRRASSRSSAASRTQRSGAPTPSSASGSQRRVGQIHDLGQHGVIGRHVPSSSSSGKKSGSTRTTTTGGRDSRMSIQQQQQNSDRRSKSSLSQMSGVSVGGEEDLQALERQVHESNRKVPSAGVNEFMSDDADAHVPDPRLIQGETPKQRKSRMERHETQRKHRRTRLSSLSLLSSNVSDSGSLTRKEFGLLSA